MGSLAALYNSQGQYAKAEPLYVDTLEQITRDTALQLTSNQNCGFPGESPNNVFGFGRINSVAAVEQAMSQLFSDGFE